MITVVEMLHDNDNQKAPEYKVSWFALALVVCSCYVAFRIAYSMLETFAIIWVML